MQFLRGDFSGRSVPLRPPWAVAEEKFVENCDRCGHCISSCPTHILNKGRGGFPVVDFSAGECLFCGDCVAACKPGVLTVSEGREPWLVRALINEETCLAWRGVECRSCGDPCEPRAIRMVPKVGGAAIPQLEFTDCNGCGACFSVCPVSAICMQPIQIQEAQ